MDGTLYHRVSSMTFQEMLSDVWSTTRTRLAKDPMESISADMKINMTPGKLRCMGVFGISYFVVVAVIIVTTSLGWTMPEVYSDNPDGHSLRLYFSLYILMNMIVNFALTVKNPGFYEGSKTLESLGLLPDISWQKCIDCDHLKPPRTHHCPLCGKCVMKRDHHCFFTGSCVGFVNQRYFVVFCFYCALGTAYAFYVTFQYLTIEHLHPSVSNFHHFMLPVTFIEWLCGYASAGFLYYVFMAWLCLVTFMGSTGIFIWQFFLAAWGTTTHEYWKSRSNQTVSIGQHLRSVFGSCWVLSFIIPVPLCKTRGNGMEWASAKGR